MSSTNNNIIHSKTASKIKKLASFLEKNTALDVEWKIILVVIPEQEKEEKQ